MTNYARVNKVTGEKDKEEEERRFRVLPPENPPHKSWVWLPIVVTYPTFDDMAEVRTGPVESRIGDESHKVWTVRPMTPAERDEAKDRFIDPDDSVRFKVLFNLENRMRALEGKQSVTASQYRTFLRSQV